MKQPELFDHVAEEAKLNQKLDELLYKIKKNDADRAALVYEAMDLASTIDKQYSRNHSESVALWGKVRQSTWR